MKTPLVKQAIRQPFNGGKSARAFFECLAETNNQDDEGNPLFSVEELNFLKQLAEDRKIREDIEALLIPETPAETEEAVTPQVLEKYGSLFDQDEIQAIREHVGKH